MTTSTLRKTTAVVLVVLMCVALFSFAFVVRADDPPADTPTTTESTPVVDSTPSQTDSNGPVAPQGDAGIATGDASAQGNTSTTANSNDITTQPNASTTINASNDADTASTENVDAGTGTNNASGSNAGVATGNAIASANVINVINTNVINSFGLMQFLNFLFGGGIDLRGMDLSYFLNPTAASTGCNLSSCRNGGSLNITSNNTADVNNTLLVRASTGDNSATAGEGDAQIDTGNAYASGNLVNVVNSNFINSNYLLVAVNNFGNLNGDITLPNADFFSQLMGAASFPRHTSIDVDNTANVTNTTDVQADSGNNTAQGGSEAGGATIQTGNSLASNATTNLINQNMVGGTTVYILVNILGDWSGGVQGLPQGLTWAPTPTGIAIMSDGSAQGGGSGAPFSGLSNLNINNNNTANVNNDVSVYALTGDNRASSASSTASVNTGNAYASSNIVNMVNTNVVGQNWIFAIFNIFGNWNGNFSFGHPDLWIGGMANSESPAREGDTIKYTFTVSNHGDADAHNVKIKSLFNTHMLNFGDAGDTWMLGDIPKGGTKEFSYSAKAGDPEGQVVAVPLSATVSSQETDNNPDDNTENLTVLIGIPKPPTTGSGPTSKFTSDPKVTIVKTSSVATTTIPSTVDYKVVITNNGGPMYKAELTDTLVGPTGDLVYERSWDLDTIETGDEITLTYQIEYKDTSLPGLYKNTARLTGTEGNADWRFANDIQPIEASNVVELEKGEGQVLGATTVPLACAAYITTYIKPGEKNDETQVKRLQYFLRDFEGAKLDITGEYGPVTLAAVQKFQNKYESDILGPWGTSYASGYVYYTTQKKINEIYCQGISAFPLSDAQQNTILGWKNGILGSPFTGKPQKFDVSTNQYYKPIDIGGNQSFFSMLQNLLSFNLARAQER